MKTLKKYRFFIFTVILLVGVVLLNRQLGIKALGIVGFSLKEMMLVIPPIFILLGLLDIWVPKETMVRYMGEDAGWLGVILAILLGSAAAGPLYGAFPIAGVFMKKGVRFTNILIFIGAWSTTKIPMFLFEMASLGTRFALTRLAIDIPGIILIAYILNFFVSKEEIEGIYKKAESLS